MARSGTARADSGSGRTRLIHASSTARGRYTDVAAVSVQRLPSSSLGNRILRAETGGRIQAQTTGERPEFGSQTGPRLTNLPELRGFLSPGKPGRFARTAWWIIPDQIADHTTMRCGIPASTFASGKRNFARRDCRANSTDEPSNCPKIRVRDRLGADYPLKSRLHSV
jgi:hypothetical protein